MNKSDFKDSLHMKYSNITMDLLSNIHKERIFAEKILWQQVQRRHSEVLQHQHVQRHERVL